MLNVQILVVLGILMDRKVVFIKDLQRLESIASIASFLFMETDFYISLGMAVETYLGDPSADNYKIMHNAFSKCLDRYPKFHNARQQQVLKLIDNGNIKTIKENLEEPIKEESIKEKSSNIVSLFPIKPVDK